MRGCHGFWGVLCLLLAVTLGGFTGGCQTGVSKAEMALNTATIAANADAITIETMQSLAIVMYRTEQEMAIAVATEKKESREQVQARVAVIRAWWAPVWETFDKARMVHQALVKVLSTGKDAVNQGSVDAFQSKLTENMIALRNYVAQARTRVQGGLN